MNSFKAFGPLFVILFVEITSGAAAFGATKQSIPGSSVIVKWTSTYCSGRIAESSSQGMLRINYDDPNCGNSSDWISESSAVDLNLVSSYTYYRYFSKHQISVGQSVLVNWAGVLCSGKVNKISDTGFVNVVFDNKNCGTDGEWQSAREIVAK